MLNSYVLVNQRVEFPQESSEIARSMWNFETHSYQVDTSRKQIYITMSLQYCFVCVCVQSLPFSSIYSFYVSSFLLQLHILGKLE